MRGAKLIKSGNRHSYNSLENRREMIGPDTGVGKRARLCSELGRTENTYGPLLDELLPGGEGGERRQKLVPQLHTDRHVQVGLHPGHYQRLRGHVRSGQASPGEKECPAGLLHEMSPNTGCLPDKQGQIELRAAKAPVTKDHC